MLIGARLGVSTNNEGPRDLLIDLTDGRSTARAEASRSAFRDHVLGQVDLTRPSSGVRRQRTPTDEVRPGAQVDTRDGRTCPTWHTSLPKSPADESGTEADEWCQCNEKPVASSLVARLGVLVGA